MKKLLFGLLSFILLLQFSSPTSAQISRTAVATRGNWSVPNESVIPSHATLGYKLTHNPLPATITVPNADMLPVTSSFPWQSNGRALHNIQIDPSDPNTIHAVLTGTTDVTAQDTATLSTRRCFYTVSHDAGKTWSTPITFSSVRTGYADMILFQRGGKWVPMIAAHRLINSSPTADVESGLWIMKDDGTFSENLVDAASTKIFWPCIAMSPDNKKVYMIASFQATGNQLQFGTWTMAADGMSATFDGWSALPGGNDANYSDAGLTSGGDYRIRVSPSGKIGVMWFNNSSSSGSYQNVFYSESTDGGANWSSALTLVATLGDADANGFIPTPTPSIDFWYNGETPRFFFVTYNTTTQQYEPYTATLFYADGIDAANGTTNTPIPVANADITGQNPGAIPNIMNTTGGSPIQPQGLHISFVTSAVTNSPKDFAVFYQTLVGADSEIYSTDTGDVVLPFASIFYSTTTDGGQTWNAPQPFETNSGSGQQYDYRFPQTSYFNPIIDGKPLYHSVFEVDTAAGFEDVYGWPGFDVLTFAHSSVVGPTASSGVRGNNAMAMSVNVWPNPVTASATIELTAATNGVAHVSILDPLGRVKFAATRSIASGATASLDVNPLTLGLANGVYYVSATIDGTTVTREIVISR